jgi:SAM-dependent methyltransferase
MPTTVEVRSTPVLSGLDEVTVPPGDWEELTACGACCEADALRDVVTVAGRLQAGTVLAVCDRCEHAFLRRRPTQSWFDRYYAAEWDARGRSADAVETRVARKVAAFCAPCLGERARVLDMGAGFGSQLLGFRELGHEPYGLERSEHRAARIESLGIPCSYGPFERAELPEGLDLIYSHHVLEHTGDPELVLRRCADALQPGGLVYVAVPNLWHEHPVQTVHFVPHLSTFTERSLETLMARCGLEMVVRQVDRELQVLARRTEEQARSAQGSNEQFGAAVADWLIAGFGGGPGQHLLLWWKSPDKSTVYEWEVRAARASRHFARADALEKRLPLAGRAIRARLWPAVASRTARSLEVDALVEGSTKLPIEVRHPADEATVWVK